MNARGGWILGVMVAIWLVAGLPARADLTEALFAAAEKGQGAQVERYLRSGADPNMANRHGVTPLLAAVRAGHEDAARALIAFGASVTQPDLGGHTPLSEARRLGHSFLVGMLEQQTGFAYGVSKLNGRAGHHRLAGGVLAIAAQADGHMVYTFRKPGMTFSEALMAARALGGPGLDYGMPIHEAGLVSFAPPQGVGEPPGHVVAIIKMAGWQPTEVRVTVR